ncbi:MAG: hypothetical protein WC151_00070 [Bacteroidales bacterium]|nr:hypothetical protein [Bacteroidales bacterium]MDY0284716.1 hypothetical protein [Bacteroidales bacterium]HPE86938.1 hypothetical protein [Bacteroidales bacterium]
MKAKPQLHFLTHDQIHKEKWDACILASFNGLPYAESWYLDLVSPGWCAITDAEYQRIMPLPAKKKLGIPYLIQPLFVQQLGIFSTKQLDATVIQAFLAAIPGRYFYIHIHLNTQNHLLHPAAINRNHELDLIDPYAILRAKYAENTLRNLRKAEKNGLSVVKHVRPESIVQLFRNDRGRQVTQWGESQYTLLLNLLYTGIHKNRMDTYGVMDNKNTLIAAAVFLKSPKRIIFLFSGNSTEGKKSGAMPLLIDRYIEDHTEMHLILDFEGSNDENLARFYRSFGSTAIHYPTVRKIRLPGCLQKPVLRILSR